MCGLGQRRDKVLEHQTAGFKSSVLHLQPVTIHSVASTLESPSPPEIGIICTHTGPPHLESGERIQCRNWSYRAQPRPGTYSTMMVLFPLQVWALCTLSTDTQTRKGGSWMRGEKKECKALLPLLQEDAFSSLCAEDIPSSKSQVVPALLQPTF